ncbi:MAG TPA: universal stress protein, UspA [Gammaproteobacteria bacterium]|nr:universal stress protein, UspA [Gammaproteobacteria bacterium]
MQRFKDILCVVVADSRSETALRRAVTLAENNQASLTVISVIDEIPSDMKLLNRALWPADFRQKRMLEQQKRLQKRIDPWDKSGKIRIRVLVGIPFLQIIREVLRNGHDLVIKMAESGGLMDRVFGSDDMHLLRKCPCPVWLVKPESGKTYRRILAAVDVDDYYSQEELDTRRLLNVQILEMASSLALSEFAELYIVHAWDDIGENAMRHPFADIPEEQITTYIEEAKQRHRQHLNLLMNETINKLGNNALEYLKPQIFLLKGSPRKEIPAFAAEIGVDLVIMGTVARTGIPGFFMGNTAETILNRLDCSILAVKPPGFATPVTLES